MAMSQATSSSGGAASPKKEKAAQEVVLRQYLTFHLGSELFALPIEHIREIIEYCNITSIPLMPDFLRGVMNLRGSVVPVIDLSSRFGRDLTTVGRRTCVIILEVNNPDIDLQLLGVLVDSVSEVMSIDMDQVEARPSFGANLRTDFIEGILKVDDRMVIILDVRQVVSLQELAELVGLAAGDVDSADISAS
jgi:purine-binding chemotaxis protein CheW